MSKPNASQAAIKLARANQLDIGQIKGTGSGDQVTKADVEKTIADRGKPAEGEAAAAAGAEDAGAGSSEQAPKPGNQVSEAGQAGPTADDNGPTLSAEAQAEAQAEARAKEAEEEAGKKTLEIARVRDDLTSVWWCPFCDNSQPGEHKTCGGCGAERQGDNVVAEVGEKVKGP